MHPDQSLAYMDAWKRREKRIDTRNAALQLVVAASQGVKISGRKPKLSDFLPDYCIDKPKDPQAREREIQKAFQLLAKRSQKHGK